MFKGNALANENVAIGIMSDQNQEIKTTVQADANGNWEYRPTDPLAPGTYTITIASPDTTGEILTVTNTFVVNASGSQFTEPSISPSPSFDVTPSASPTPTIPTPTLSPTDSPTPTITSPTPTTNASQSATITQPPIPQAGSESVFVVMIGAMLSIGIGVLLFFLSRGSITV
jgi:hypothetical protein